MWNACHLIAWMKNIKITEHLEREREKRVLSKYFQALEQLIVNQLVIHKRLNCFSAVSTSEEKSISKTDETHRSVLESRILTYRQFANNSSH
jgi:hypothetical protein